MLVSEVDGRVLLRGGGRGGEEGLLGWMKAFLAGSCRGSVMSFDCTRAVSKCETCNPHVVLTGFNFYLLYAQVPASLGYVRNDRHYCNTRLRILDKRRDV